MKRIVEILAAIGGGLLAFATNLPPIIWVLMGIMSMDYVTGLICGFLGKSHKTEMGGLSSGAAFQGLMKKIVILIVVGMAALVDQAIGHIAGMEMVAVTGATCMWFVASEGLSVLENAASMGIKIPQVLLKALEIVRQKGDVPEDGE